MKCDNVSGQCFWYGVALTTSAEANASCRSHGGELATLDTEHKYDFAVAMIPSLGYALCGSSRVW